jgi:cell wall-associated NlpC family hydrolase
MKRKRVWACCAVILFLPLLWGCAPKKVRVYESLTDLRASIVHAAVSLQGKAYRNGTKGPDSFDCSGFVHYVYKKVNVLLPVSTDGLVRAGSDVGRDNAVPGDLVFFKLKKDLHVGILLGRREFIHASKSRGVAVDDLESPYWRRSLLGFRSIL